MSEDAVTGQGAEQGGRIRIDYLFISLLSVLSLSLASTGRVSDLCDILLLLL